MICAHGTWTLFLTTFPTIEQILAMQVGICDGRFQRQLHGHQRNLLTPLLGLRQHRGGTFSSIWLNQHKNQITQSDFGYPPSAAHKHQEKANSRQRVEPPILPTATAHEESRSTHSELLSSAQHVLQTLNLHADMDAQQLPRVPQVTHRTQVVLMEQSRHQRQAHAQHRDSCAIHIRSHRKSSPTSQNQNEQMRTPPKSAS